MSSREALTSRDLTTSRTVMTSRETIAPLNDAMTSSDSPSDSEIPDDGERYDGSDLPDNVPISSLWPLALSSTSMVAVPRSSTSTPFDRLAIYQPRPPSGLTATLPPSSLLLLRPDDLLLWSATARRRTYYDDPATMTGCHFEDSRRVLSERLGRASPDDVSDTEFCRHPTTTMMAGLSRLPPTGSDEINDGDRLRSSRFTSFFVADILGSRPSSSSFGASIGHGPVAARSEKDTASMVDLQVIGCEAVAMRPDLKTHCRGPRFNRDAFREPSRERSEYLYPRKLRTS